ncbi:hypothetical protein MTP99_000099 [Tenebrio molitor]|nr:hypothetical protein MTP99_000099 [Tenebrio molitor]
MFSSPVGKIHPSSVRNPTLFMRRGFFVVSETIQISISSVVRGEIEQRLRKPQTTTQLIDSRLSESRFTETPRHPKRREILYPPF